MCSIETNNGSHRPDESAIGHGTVWYSRLRRSGLRGRGLPAAKVGGRERSDLFVSSFGSYGQYLRRSLKPFVHAGEDFREQSRPRDSVPVEALKPKCKVRNGYQHPDALRWVPGDGEVVRWSHRLLEIGEMPPEIRTAIFRRTKMKGSRKNTAQVNERRAGGRKKINQPPVQHTMELGVT